MFEAKTVTFDTLKDEVEKLLDGGWRFVTMSAVDLKDEGQQILYHFDKDFNELNLRLAFSAGTEIPSISGIYLTAVLEENEIRDMFDIRFSGLPLDYNGSLYLEGEVVRGPMCNYTIIKR